MAIGLLIFLFDLCIVVRITWFGVLELAIGADIVVRCDVSESTRVIGDI